MSSVSTYHHRSIRALEIALQATPAYASWQALDPGPDTPVDHRYHALPVVTKQDLRAHFPDGFVPGGKNPREGLATGEIDWVQTSGTTEEQVTTLWCQAWWNASERASWQLNAHAARVATGNHPEAILTSPICTGVLSRQGPLPMNARRLDRFLYLNEFEDPDAWTTGQIERMARELEAFRPITLEANPAFLARFARRAADLQMDVYQPPLIILTYEFPSRLHLRQIRRTFGSPVASSYGSTETGYVFMTCEAGCLHENVECCRVDLQSLAERHGGPSLARLLVTPFGHPWFALLRFGIGDLGRVAPPGSCPCGRTAGLTLTAIEGRLTDVTLTTDGRAVTVNQIDEALAALPELVAYQVIQHAPGAYRLRMVTEPRAHLRAEAATALRSIYGREARLTITEEAALPPGSSGKHRLAICEFPVPIETLLAPHGDPA